MFLLDANVLLALALKRRARLITLDRRIDPKLLPGGITAYQVLSK